MNTLEKIGYCQWVQESVDQGLLQEFALVRVVAVHKESYTVSTGAADIPGELLGRLMFNATSPEDYPAVGDWVLAQLYDDNSLAIIHHLVSRRSVLQRKTPGKKVEFQLIAANIDVAFIVQSLNENFNIRRLERYLVMVHESHIQPVVLLSKSDLLSPEEIALRIAEIQAIMPQLQVVPFSNTEEASLQGVRELLLPGQTYCLLGSSGVGKTSLLNNLLGEASFVTKEVSRKESKGRHATTHRQLVQLDSGALVIDTPGMRELGNISVEAGLDETFSEIAALTKGCRFSDCTHTQEKGCAVLEAIAQGQLSEDRYQNYLKMSKESAYNELSYLEKRRKDKRFGKHCKTVMQEKKRLR